jgi:hypothetical protein
MNGGTNHTLFAAAPKPEPVFSGFLQVVDPSEPAGLEWDEPNEADMASIRAYAQHLVQRAAVYGLVVTIEQVPRQPLAMGNYESVITVRPARNPG